MIGLKKTCLGDFRIEEIREKDNETGLKEGEGIEMSIYSAFHIRDARSLRLKYLPCGLGSKSKIGLRTTGILGLDGKTPNSCS